MTTRTKPCPGKCGNTCYTYANYCGDCYKKRRLAAAINPRTLKAHSMELDRSSGRAMRDYQSLQHKYKEALKLIEHQERQLGASQRLSASIDTFAIKPVKPSREGEAVAVVLASDWHGEERVGPEINNLNVFSLDIFRRRAEQFFQKTLRLTNLLSQDISISSMVLALLGDFITGNIHGEENAEMNQLPPTEAIVLAQTIIASGIEFLLKHSKLKLVIPCHSGNHARTTHTTRFGAENGHSLEFLMYHYLAAYFRSQPRVRFIIPPGPHSYIDVYDVKVRFQHGHMIKYNGGVGGLYIPTFKAISKWNEAQHADLDCFGHFHQMVDGGKFICNGSLIGYNSFALSIKASFEKPKQALFLIDKKRGKTCVWPILLK